MKKMKKISLFLAIVMTLSCFASLGFAYDLGGNVQTLAAYEFDGDSEIVASQTGRGIPANAETGKFYSYVASGKTAPAIEDGQLKFTDFGTDAYFSIPKVNSGTVTFSADVTLNTASEGNLNEFFRMMAADEQMLYGSSPVNLLRMFSYNTTNQIRHPDDGTALSGFTWSDGVVNKLKISYNLDNNSLAINLNGKEKVVYDYLTDLTQIYGLGFQFDMSGEESSAIVDNVVVKHSSVQELKSYDFSTTPTFAVVSGYAMPSATSYVEDTFYYLNYSSIGEAPTVVDGQLRLYANTNADLGTTTGRNKNSFAFGFASISSGVIKWSFDITPTISTESGEGRIYIGTVNSGTANSDFRKLITFVGDGTATERSFWKYIDHSASNQGESAETNLNWVNGEKISMGITYNFDTDALTVDLGEGEVATYENIDSTGVLDVVRALRVEVHGAKPVEALIDNVKVEISANAADFPVSVATKPVATPVTDLPESADGRKVWAVTNMSATKFADYKVIAVLTNKTENDVIEKELTLGFDAGEADVDFNLYTSVLNNPDADIELSFRFDTK